MARFAFHQWDINVPEPEEGKPYTLGDGAVLLALLMDLRDQQAAILTQLQTMNAKSDAVIQASAMAAQKRRFWRW